MDHEDFEQIVGYLENGTEIWISLCTCGSAFWDEDSGEAYAKWEQHESDRGY